MTTSDKQSDLGRVNEAIEQLATEIVRLRRNLAADPNDFEADCKLPICEEELRQAVAYRSTLGEFA